MSPLNLEGSLPSFSTEDPEARSWSLLVFFLQNMLQGDSVQSLVNSLMLDQVNSDWLNVHACK